MSNRQNIARAKAIEKANKSVCLRSIRNLTRKEKFYIKQYADAGYQLRNVSIGGQGENRERIKKHKYNESASAWKFSGYALCLNCNIPEVKYCCEGKTKIECGYCGYKNVWTE